MARRTDFLAAESVSQCGMPNQNNPARRHRSKSTSTHPNAFHSQQRAQFFQLARNVTPSHGTMVGRSLHVPLVEESPCANREAVSAVGVSDFENWARHGLALSYKQLELAVHRLDHRKHGHWSMLD